MRQALFDVTGFGEMVFGSTNDAARPFDCKGSDLEVSQRMLNISHAKYIVITIGSKAHLLRDNELKSEGTLLT